MKNDNPIFKKIDTFEDGQLCEKFFINDKEVDEKTYYSLLEDGVVNNDYENKQSKKKSMRTSKNKKKETDVDEQYDYMYNLVDLVRSVDTDKAINLLSSEFLLQYRLGYHISQVQLCDSFVKVMKHNASIAKDSLNGLLDAYNID